MTSRPAHLLGFHIDVRAGCYQFLDDIIATPGDGVHQRRDVVAVQWVDFEILEMKD